MYKLFAILFFSISFNASADNFIVQKSNRVYVDALGNILFLNKNEIIKYNANLKFVSRYSNNWLSNPSFVDVQNPLRTLLHYSQQAKYIQLDWMLSPISIEFNKYTEFATLLCNSINNGMWVFNQANQSLTRYDEKWIEASRINNVNMLIDDFTPELIVESNNQLYIYDSNYGYVIISLFGTILQKIPFPKILHHHVYQNTIVFKKQNTNTTYLLDTKNIALDSVTINSNYQDFYITNKNIYLLKSDTLFIKNKP